LQVAVRNGPFRVFEETVEVERNSFLVNVPGRSVLQPDPETVKQYVAAVRKLDPRKK
jgi:hypothetical protein